MRYVWLTRILVALVGAGTLAAEQAPPPIELKTLTYAVRDGQELVLDLYTPATPPGTRLPVIVFLHGGGWAGGTRTTGPDFRRFFAGDGFAMVSIEYRLTPAITFPANVEDVKTAVRWLRANAGAHRLDSDRICLWGTSAGGHLASVAGLAPKGTFEGTDNMDQSSAVRCVLDAYGPTDFLVMDAQTEQERPTLQAQPPALLAAPPMVGGVVVDGRAAGAAAAPGGGRGAGRGGPGRGGVPQPHDAATSPESRLVGAPVQTVPERVRAANPITYVRADAPPFLIMHGLADNSVPHGQSVLLYDALKNAGTAVTLRLIDGLPHTFFNRSDLDMLAGPFRMTVREHPRGGPERMAEDRAGVFEVARDFFRTHLR